jgi:PAS domain S-box-containing protein
MKYQKKTKKQLINELMELWQRINELGALEKKHTRAEEALSASELQYRTTVDSMSDAIHLVDQDLRIILINRAFENWCEELGLKMDGIGKNVFDLFPFLPEKVHDEYREVFNTGKILVTEESNQVGDREIVTETRKIPIFEGKRVIRVVTVVHDITERKRAEEALGESEKRVRHKLDAILSPEADIGALELSDIIESEKIQKLMDEFYQLTNVGIGIIDLHGRVLVGTGWQDICTKFHRVNPESCRLCIESDLELTRNVSIGTFKQYRCKNNMWDIATPIMIGDKHVGNIFLGQFLFDDETPDYEAFRQQAHRYGFNEQEYIAALDRVPRWNRKMVNAAMSFYTAFAGMIGNLSYSNIKLANALEERKRTEEALRQSEQRKTILNQIATIFLTIPDEEMYGEVLAVVLQAMKSKYGIFGYIGDNGELIMPSLTREVWGECRVPGKSIVFPSDTWGESLWGRAIREKKAFYSDGPFRTPEGHVYIDNFLTVPILFGKETIGLLSVANKEVGYTEEDKELQESIANFISPILNARLQRDRMEQERKRAEELLRESEERYRSLVESARDAIFTLSPTGMITSLNTAFKEITGWSCAEWIDKPFASILHPDELPIAMDLFRRTLQGEMPPMFELRILLNSGEYLFGEFTVTPQIQEGIVKGILGIARDITERKRAEEALQQAEEHARQSAQENAVMAEIGRIISSTLNIDDIYESFSEEVKKIISFDRIVINVIDTEKGTVKNVYMAGGGVQDRKVGKIYPLEGSGNAEIVRTKSTLLIQTEDFSEYKDRFPMLWSTFQAGFRSIMDVPLFSKGKIIGGLLLRSRKPNAYTGEDVRLAERIASQIAGAIANVQLYAERIQVEQEREVLQEQLRQSQKMEAIGLLAGGIAHDFGNLLAIVQGYSELSLLKLPQEDALRENIEQVKNAGGRAMDLIRRLLAFSRRQIFQTSVLDLNTILRDLEKMLRRIIGEDIELVTLLASDLGKVEADPGQIEQILLNLAVNARDAMPSGGKLTIETTNIELDKTYARSHVAVKPGRYLMVSVTDTGVGITPEVRERVFEPFFTTKERDKGTGLGLSTVYGIVKQSGGNIWVYSEPGYGTTFKIYLPRVDEALKQAGEKKLLEEFPRGNETVLVVEDEEEVLKLVLQILRVQGYKVLEAPRGGDALLISKQHEGPIHLLVTDVVMPEMNGQELAKRLASFRPEMKVLYMSAYPDNTVVHHGVLEKGVNFIQKPFTVAGLASKVRQALDK